MSVDRPCFHPITGIEYIAPKTVKNRIWLGVPICPLPRPKINGIVRAVPAAPIVLTYATNFGLGIASSCAYSGLSGAHALESSSGITYPRLEAGGAWAVAGPAVLAGPLLGLAFTFGFSRMGGAAAPMNPDKSLGSMSSSSSSVEDNEDSNQESHHRTFR